MGQISFQNQPNAICTHVGGNAFIEKVAMTQNNFILQEVIDDLINSEKSLVGPLMKLNYFGRLTKNRELVNFTNSEINGYKQQDSEVPPYRKTPGTLMVDTQAYMNRHMLTVPVSLLDAPFNEALKYIDVREGISAVEKMAQEMIESKGGKQEFYRPIPMEMLHAIQPALRKLYKSDVRLDAVGAKMIGNGNVILEIPNFIRTKLLDFVMQIADKFGYDIEIQSFNKRETNNQTINHIMNTTINTSGDGNLVNIGSNNTIHSKVVINKGDLKQLTDELTRQGIDEEDVQEIASIVQQETPAKNDKLGDKANSWILKIVEKSLKGVGKIATGVSSNLLAGLIKSYYGMD